MSTAELPTELDRLNASIKFIRDGVERMSAKLRTYEEREQTVFAAFATLVERDLISAEEAAQLGIGRLVPGSPGSKPVLAFMSLEDLKDMNDAAMKKQATVAKFRQIKQHFVTHQRAVSHILDHINHLTKTNQVTAADIEQLRAMRDALSDEIGRKV